MEFHSFVFRVIVCVRWRILTRAESNGVSELVPVKNLSECSFYDRKNEMKCKGFEQSIIQETEEYINISKAFGSSLVEKAGASTAFNSFVPINKIAEIKGLTSNRSLRLAIQKGKYIAREVKVFGGTSYEILYSSLEPEVQEKLQDEGCFSP